VAQAAVKRVIEPIFEQMFAPTSFGFRPGAAARMRCGVVDGLLQAGYTHVVDADLKGYFDSIPHDRLKQRLAAHISDSRLLALLDGWIEQDVVQELKRWTPTSGTPQGAVISPLLANLYLHDLDVKLAGLGLSMVRYADDFVILCRSAAEAAHALDVVRAWVQRKAAAASGQDPCGDCRLAGQGFEFLGYRFEAGRRWVRDKSLKALKAKIRSQTRRTEGNSLRQIVSRSESDAAGLVQLLQTRPARDVSARSTASSGDGCGRFCANKPSARGPAAAWPTICAGRMPTSLLPGFSP
jgi:RNA-directed DNA polymerase